MCNLASWLLIYAVADHAVTAKTPLVAIASHVAGVTEMAQSSVLILLQFTIPEYCSVCYTIRLIMECDGISLDFGKKFFKVKLLGTLQKQSSSSVAWGMVHLIKRAQVISYLIGCRVFWYC